MEQEEKLYEITAYTENHVGLLYSIAGIFMRRSINIEKLLVYPSLAPGIHKFKILARTSEVQIQAVILQIEKKVDVIKAFYHEDGEYSAREIEAVREFLKDRENNNK